MRMTVWDPMRVMRQMSDWEDNWGMLDWDSNEMDVYDEGESIIVKIKAPGFDEKNVEITVDGNNLTVTGKMEKSEEEEDKKKKYYRKEMTMRSFTRTTTLPSKVLADKADAKFRNGILTLTLPKAEEDKPKKITIKAS